jgi:hypothetical protein
VGIQLLCLHGGQDTPSAKGAWCIREPSWLRISDVFEEECHRKSKKLFVLPPHSPKLNGHAERAQKTHTVEFYEVTMLTLKFVSLTRLHLNGRKFIILSGSIKHWDILHHKNFSNAINKTKKGSEITVHCIIPCPKRN